MSVRPGGGYSFGNSRDEDAQPTDRTSPVVYLMFGVAALLVVVATTKLFSGDLDGVGRYGYAAIGVCGFGVAVRAQDRLVQVERRLRELKEKRPEGGQMPRYHPTPPEDVQAVLSDSLVPLCSRVECYNDAKGFNGEECGEHEDET